MRNFRFLLIALAITACGSKETATQPVDFSNVRIEDGFWSPRLDLHKTATIPICIDQIEKETGRMRNFEKSTGWVAVSLLPQAVIASAIRRKRKFLIRIRTKGLR